MPSQDAKLGLNNIFTRCCQNYFLFIGKLSHLNDGINLLESTGIMQQYVPSALLPPPTQSYPRQPSPNQPNTPHWPRLFPLSHSPDFAPYDCSHCCPRCLTAAVPTAAHWTLPLHPSHPRLLPLASCPRLMLRTHPSFVCVWSNHLNVS